MVGDIITKSAGQERRMDIYARKGR